MDPEDVAIDHEFHMGLAEASHNAFMVAVEDFVVSMLADIRARGLAVEGRAAKIVEEHDGILQAVRGRDKALRKERICAHLDNIEMIVRMGPSDEPQARAGITAAAFDVAQYMLNQNVLFYCARQ